MKAYEKVYEQLRLPSELIFLANGKIKLPRGTVEQPANCYGFPPAMIPFFSSPDSLIYTGYWKHWFCNRSPGFVRMYVNTLYRIAEYARTVKQLQQYLVLSEIVFADELTEEIRNFAKKLHVENVDTLDEHTNIYGDRPSGFLKLSDFFIDPPLICFIEPEKYEGDFPHTGMVLDKESMSLSCSLELNETLEKEYIQKKFCPPWFKDSDKKNLFNALLDEEKLSDAWFTLNSNGWTFSDAKCALTALANKSNDIAFHQLAEAWSSLEHSKYKIGY